MVVAEVLLRIYSLFEIQKKNYDLQNDEYKTVHFNRFYCVLIRLHIV